MTLWQKLRQEAVGVWRSVRYDVNTWRAAKIANAFTEEFRPGPNESLPRRMVPLIGVALLLAGGVSGTFLAVSGGLAALSTDRGTPAIGQPALGRPAAVPAEGPAATAAASGLAADAAVAGGPPNRRPKRSPEVTTAATTVPSHTPQPESSTLPSPTPTPSPSASPSPSPAPSTTTSP